MFVEAKIKEQHNTSYRDCDVISRMGHVSNNTCGGSLVQCHSNLNISKNNAHSLNNNLNEAIYFSIPFKIEKLHIFLIYIHPHLEIEETIFTRAALYRYSKILVDFNPKEAKN